MSSVASLQDYKQRLAGVNPDKIVGSILWFTIEGARVTWDDMNQWFLDLGLDSTYLPKRIKPVDAFRRATSKAECEYKLPQEGQSATLTIREVDYNEEQVIRHVVREVRDRKGKALTFDPMVGEAIFYRQSRSAKNQGLGGEKVRFTVDPHKVLPKDERDRVQELVDKTYAEYTEMAAFLDSQAVRAVIRNYVRDLNAIAVKPSGGVYFVHANRQPTLDAIQELVRRIGNGCVFHTLPLLDTEEQREMLTDAFQDSVVNQCDGLLKEIAEINEKYGKEIPPSVYARISNAYRDAVERSEEHTRILGLAQGRAGSSLELALDSVMEMATRIKS